MNPYYVSLRRIITDENYFAIRTKTIMIVMMYRYTYLFVKLPTMDMRTIIKMLTLQSRIYRNILKESI